MELLILLVVVVVFSIWIYRVSVRVEELEAQLRRGEAPQHMQAIQPSGEPAHWTDTEQQSPEGTANQNGSPQYVTETREPGTISTFFSWCARDWLMKLGGLLVLLGVGWFVSYAFANNWIGPMGRIGLGLGVGALILALGRYRMQAAVAQGGIVMVVGAVTMMLTIYAAREVYDFFTPTTALVLMFGISALLGFTAVMFNRRPLAYANALMAGVAPLMIVAADPSVPGLLSYLLVVTAGALWIVAVTGWRELVPIALGVVGLYSFSLFATHAQSDVEVGLLFSFVFAALFFISAALGMCRVRMGAHSDVATALLTGLFLFSWIQVAAPEEWQAMLFIGWALTFALGAQLVYRVSGVATHFYVYGAVAATYLAVATALLLDGPALVVAFTLESTALIILSYVVTRTEKFVPVSALTFFLPMFLSVESITSHVWSTGVFHAHAFVLVLIMAALCGIALFYMHLQRREALSGGASTLQTIATTTWSFFGLYLFVFVWLVMHALFIDDMGTMVALLIYTLTGCTFYIHGKQTGAGWERVVAGILVALVVGRLLLVDVWQMELFGKVITFLCIGVLLMVVAWIEQGTRAKGDVQEKDTR